MSDSESWIDFLSDGDADSLRSAGWKIEIDPKIGLTIRDVAEFFPEIESEQDHGIDWFRFDISGEMDGKKVQPHPADSKRHLRRRPRWAHAT